MLERLERVGKPTIAHPKDIAPLSFNLSHTERLIVCLVALDREVGVDAEDTERAGETVEVADRFFSPTEVAALRALPAQSRRRRFFQYWTLKEAYIKARGMGLSLPLKPVRPCSSSPSPTLSPKTTTTRT